MSGKEQSKSLATAEPSEFVEAPLREVAIALHAADALLGDFENADPALLWSRQLFTTVDIDPLWANGRHHGDCTKQAETCLRCVVEQFEAKAREFAAAEEMTFADDTQTAPPSPKSSRPSASRKGE